MDNKKALLKSNEVFSSLKDDEIDAIAIYSSFYPYSKGDLVFAEGDIMQEICIVVKGEISVRHDRGDGKIEEIARIIEGDSFGELDLLTGDPKSEFAVAETDSTLLVFPSRDFSFKDFIVSEAAASSGILMRLLSTISGRIRWYNRMISEKSRWIEDIKFQLYNDKLTGLYNRTYLNEELENEIRKKPASVAVIMIKPDNFKSINDNYGHEAGDGVLRLMANLIIGSISNDDIAARYRGDEFLVVAYTAGVPAALRTAEDFRRIFAYLDISSFTAGNIIPFSVSIGVASYPEESSSVSELIKLVFSRVFIAREAGGNRVVSNG